MRPPPAPRTHTCVCTCFRTASCAQTASISRASSRPYPTLHGPARDLCPPSEYAKRLPLLKRHGLTAVGVDRFPRITDRTASRRANRRYFQGAPRCPPRLRAPRSCTRASSTSMRAHWARQWSKGAFHRAWWSAKAAISGVVPRSWARFRVAARNGSPSATGCCSALMPE